MLWLKSEVCRLQCIGGGGEVSCCLMATSNLCSCHTYKTPTKPCHWDEILASFQISCELNFKTNTVPPFLSHSFVIFWSQSFAHVRSLWWMSSWSHDWSSWVLQISLESSFHSMRWSQVKSTLVFSPNKSCHILDNITKQRFMSGI